MTRKEQIKIAKKIADAEFIISTSTDPNKVARAKDTVLNISNKISNLNDLFEIELLAQEFMEEKN